MYSLPSIRTSACSLAFAHAPAFTRSCQLITSARMKPRSRSEWILPAARWAFVPRVIGQGRASELLFTGRAMTAQEGLAWGFFNALHDSDELLAKAQDMARQLAAGPMFGHAMTKNMLQQEWAMTIDQAIEAEAQAQAICMQTQDFRRAYEAFAAKQKPVFGGD